MTPLLSVADLRCERDGRELFGGLGLTLEAGRCVEVRGPNGSGKSTLLRCVAGLYREYEGHISGADRIYLGHKLGLNPLLTSEENLSWYARLNGTAAPLGDALARVGMAGYERVACRNLSAGQQRRVALARILVSPARLWLLDEPLTSLDQAGQALVPVLIEAHLAAGGAALCATHQPLAVPGSSALELGGRPP